MFFYIFLVKFSSPLNKEIIHLFIDLLERNLSLQSLISWDLLNLYYFFYIAPHLIGPLLRLEAKFIQDPFLLLNFCFDRLVL